MKCPNCGSEDNVVLFSHEYVGVLHCGCYYSGGGMFEFPDMLDAPEEEL